MESLLELNCLGLIKLRLSWNWPSKALLLIILILIGEGKSNIFSIICLGIQIIATALMLSIFRKLWATFHLCTLQSRIDLLSLNSISKRNKLYFLMRRIKSLSIWLKYFRTLIKVILIKMTTYESKITTYDIAI